MNKTSLRQRHGLGLLVLFLLVLAAGWLLAYPYTVSDWLRLRGYQAAEPVRQLADDTTMSDKARHLFYLNRPQLEDKTTFRQACPQANEQTIVIGCYLGGQRGIHLLAVTDERLAGVEQVTAAHEMLHAAYERLSKAERKRVDGMLEDYAKHNLRDERIVSVLKAYETSEPGQQSNEMHSIFATEVAELPADLEAYYAQYFTDRRKVAGYAASYQAAFTTRQARVQSFDRQLQSIGDAIKSATTQLEQQSSAITSQRQRLDGLRASGQIETYNQGVAGFNQQVEDYNGLLGRTRAQIEQYNTIVGQRNSIAEQTAELQQAINSADLPAQQ